MCDLEPGATQGCSSLLKGAVNAIQQGEKKGKVEKKTCICSPGAGVQVVEQSHQMVVGMVTRDGKKNPKPGPLSDTR